MLIIQPIMFHKFSRIIFGFSTRIGLNRKAPYYFNLSFQVGDDDNIVEENRAHFFSALGLSSHRIAFQKQVHDDNISYVQHAGNCGNSDAMITDKLNLGLTISTADCTPVFIYDYKNKVIAGVHSGWRSTEKKILEKTLFRLRSDFNSSPENLIVYIGPSISWENYEVGEKVAVLFDPKYLRQSSKKFLLDVAGVNYDILIKFGVNKNNIQRSNLCTFRMNNLLHSYRRDGQLSGRALGIIAMKE